MDVPSWLGAAAPLLADRGVGALWTHQLEALDLWRAGGDVLLATGTGSGKSLVYQAAAVESAGPRGAGTTIYVAPTKALARDQARAFAWTGLRVGVLDGDSDDVERRWAREEAQVIVTNPEMLHFGVLPRPGRWHRLLARLELVVWDECHIYRGVFGAHAAWVARRLRRLARAAGRDPRWVLASATIGSPEETAAALSGGRCAVVTDDGSPRGELRVEFVVPDENASTAAVAARMLAESVSEGRRTLAFVPSRVGAERIAARARRQTPHANRIQAYRGGLLPEERRALENGLRAGTISGVATTNALELGMDLPGVDEVIVAGWPGRRSAFWQQVGRAGRGGRSASAALVVGDNLLDQYLARHPDAIFDTDMETTVIDVANPVIARPHLVAAAAELPITSADEAEFATAMDQVDALVAQGVLRRRTQGVYWTGPGHPDLAKDLRATGGDPVRIVIAETGQLVGSVDASGAPRTVYEGAVYVHQGEYFLVIDWDKDAGVAFVVPTGDDVVTTAISSGWVHLGAVTDERRVGSAHLRLGSVTVVNRVDGFLRRRSDSGAVLSSHAIEAEQRQFQTTGVWWTWPDDVTRSAATDVAGAAHAVEHLAAGMLPLVATCDRWDVGGSSSASHPDTGGCTVVVHDAYPGGVGYAQRGFEVAQTWLDAAAAAVDDCRCDEGCPLCVQSPTCGSGNEPLDKAGAVGLLRACLPPHAARRL